MQSNHFWLDPTVHDLLHQEWERLNRRPPRVPAKNKRKTRGRQAPARCDPLCTAELSPVMTVLPGLIRLVTECADRPVNKFRPTITRLIREQQFMEAAGDSIVDPHLNVQTERYVELTLRVLERVRDQAQERGEWSDAPVTPQMFG
jgi:hypothetical protein